MWTKRLVWHVERMENDRIAKKFYVEKCAGSCSVGTQKKRWIIVHDRSVWRGFLWGNAWGVARE